jgi:hypothetical protein
VVVRYLAMGVACDGLAYRHGHCERRLLCFAGLDLLVRVDGFDSVDGVGSIAVGIICGVETDGIDADARC